MVTRHGPAHITNSPRTPSAARREVRAVRIVEAERVIYPRSAGDGAAIGLRHAG